MIHEDSIPRLNWKLGRVEKMHIGKDCISRALDLRTSGNKVITQPIQRVYVLEMTGSQEVGPLSPQLEVKNPFSNLPASHPLPLYNVWKRVFLMLHLHTLSLGMEEI